MRGRSATLILLSAILFLLLPATVNVATGSLPPAWQPYLWLAWPLAALLAIPVMLMEARSLGRAAARPAGLPGPPAGGAAAVAEQVARRELPRDLSDFTDRQAEITALMAVLTQRRPTTAAVPVCTVHGMAGVGKTALAVHVAHRLAADFPDGQLFVDLHGFSPGVAPAEPADALETLLRAVGVAPDRIPAPVEERERLYRHVLAERRVLVVLDNAASERHVRPLLPGSGGCSVLVTSRRHLAGLEGAHHLALDVLDDAGAAELMTRIAGQAWSAAGQRPRVTDVTALCGNLPLALRIVAARIATRPRRAGPLVERLRQKRDRLRELRTGGLNVEAAFAVSYEQLPAATRHTFRMLGLHPGPDLDAGAAAALCGLDRSTVDDALEPLLEAHLLGEPVPGRFRFHDLIREHAAGLAADLEPAEARQAALRRLIVHYVHQTAAAAARLSPDARQVVEWPAAPATVTSFAGYDEALAWYEVERTNLVSSVGRGVELGLDEDAWRLAHALSPYFLLCGDVEDWQRTHEWGLAAARRVGNRRAEADLLAALGVLSRRCGRYEEAVARQRQALELYAAEHDHHWVMSTLTNLAISYRRLGRFQDARAVHERALRLHTQLGDRNGEALAVTNLGLIEQRLGRYAEAREHHRRAIRLARETGDRHAEAMAMTNLGIAQLRLGEPQAAMAQHRDALRLARETGDRHAAGHTLSNLGVAEAAQGRYGEAVRFHRQGLDLLRSIGNRGDECEALIDLGAALRQGGHREEALAQLRPALELARRIADRYLTARALDGTAAAVADTDPETARRYWREALEIFSGLGVPEAAAVQRRLAGAAEEGSAAAS